MSTPITKKRRLNEEIPSVSLPFGTFTGKTIYRNRLNPNESREQAHLSIENLVPPQCTAAICTTFAMDESPEWIERVFQGVPHLIVVTHDNRPEGRCIGDAELFPFNSHWHYLFAKPHSGGCLHAKLLLFRCQEGLRVVVCGSNLYEQQWHTDRDCSWVQDFAAKNGHGGYSDFGETLQSFLSDLMVCRTDSENQIVKTRLNEVLKEIDMSTAHARLVISFPRKREDSPPADRGGYKQLAEACQKFLSELDTGSDFEESDDENTAVTSVSGWEGGVGRNVVYACAGSFGNIRPDFLLQMSQAMKGEAISASRNTQWEGVLKTVKCLWPSKETALGMNLLALLGSARPIPLSHWNKIPECGKRHCFFDATPNPSAQGLQGCHPVSHSKILYYVGNAVALIYVGSHNFSKAAWGVRNEMPKNVEIGVVLGTTSSELAKEWQDRLPCKLPKSTTSPASYTPASPPWNVMQVFQSGRIEDAIEMTRTWLQGGGQSKPKSSDIVHLCGADS